MNSRPGVRFTGRDGSRRVRPGLLRGTLPRAMCRLLAAFFLPLLTAQEPAAPANDLAAAVERIFAPCTAPGAPGAVVLVARGDQILLQRAFGLADLERSVPLTV